MPEDPKMVEGSVTVPPPTPPAPAVPPAAIKPVEAWAAEFGTPGWLFAAARARHRWPIGRELTRQAYDEALEAARTEVIR